MPQDLKDLKLDLNITANKIQKDARVRSAGVQAFQIAKWLEMAPAALTSCRHSQCTKQGCVNDGLDGDNLDLL